MAHAHDVTDKRNKPRLAVVATHPIQHFCPQFSSWHRLSEMDMQVFFASMHGVRPYHDPQFGKTIKWEGLSLDFPHSFLPDAENRQLDNMLDAPELESALEAFAPDAVLVFGWHPPLARRAIRWASRRGVRLIMYSDAENRSRKNVFKRIAKRILLPPILKKIDFFLTVGDSNEDVYIGYGAKSNQFIRTSFPINIERYNEKVEQKSAIRKKIRENIGIPDDHVVLIQVGKLVPWKRPGDLITLSNILQKSHNNVTIILAGEGAMKRDLKENATCVGPGGVFFLGFIQPDMLIDYYLAADIYVHAAEQEPHSLAISEAIYCGLPAIISDRCGSYGPTDDVRAGVNGFVYECGNIEQLKKQVLRLVQNERLRTRMSEASIRIARHHQRLAHEEAIRTLATLLES